MNIRARRGVVAAVLLLVSASMMKVAAADEMRVPFPVDATRSDPNRPARPLGEPYQGFIFDTHGHLASLEGRPTDAGAVTAAKGAAHVRRLNLLPPPNAARQMGVGASLAQMETLRQSSKGFISHLCGSDYLTSWMDDAAKLGRVPPDVDAQMARLETDLKSGACAGVGEIGFRHYIKAKGELEVNVPAAYGPLLAIAETAARLNMPLDLHAEPVEPDGKRHEAEVFGTIALMFERAPNLKLITSHNAMTNVHNARSLLQAYPTLMMNVRFGGYGQQVNWANLEGLVDERRQLYEDWAVLFEEMPDRFMLGMDFFFGGEGNVADHYAANIHLARRVLGSLPPPVAEKIGFNNARRLFGAPPGME
jgi:Amidohydrolase